MTKVRELVPDVIVNEFYKGIAVQLRLPYSWVTSITPRSVCLYSYMGVACQFVKMH